MKKPEDRERGFSLLEVVVTLSIVSSCVLLFSFAISQIGSTRAVIRDDRQIEWHLFVNQLAYELDQSKEVSASRDRVSMKRIDEISQKTEIISYERYLKMIRRQVDAKGHQPILLEVASITFSLTDHKLTIRVVFSNGETYSAAFRVNE